MHKPRGPGVSARGDPPTNRCTRAPPSSFHAAFCVKGTPAVVHLHGLNHVQPELRRRHSLRESRKGPGTHMHEPPPHERAQETRRPVSNTSGERRGHRSWARVLLQHCHGPWTIWAGRPGEGGAGGVGVGSPHDFPPGSPAHPPLSDRPGVPCWGFISGGPLPRPLKKGFCSAPSSWGLWGDHLLCRGWG